MWKNEAGGMESSGCRMRKHVSNRAGQVDLMTVLTSAMFIVGLVSYLKAD